MKIPEEIKYLEIFYDGRCGMCCTFHEWVNAQERAFGLTFIPYQDPALEHCFPNLAELEPDKQMIVRTDTGELFFGAEAWVLCLLSCKHHQGMARRLGGKVLLPVAIRACHLLATNRKKLSRVFFRKKDNAVMQELHQMENPNCGEGGCAL